MVTLQVDLRDRLPEFELDVRFEAVHGELPVAGGEASNDPTTPR